MAMSLVVIIVYTYSSMSIPTLQRPLNLGDDRVGLGWSSGLEVIYRLLLNKNLTIALLHCSFPFYCLSKLRVL